MIKKKREGYPALISFAVYMLTGLFSFMDKFRTTGSFLNFIIETIVFSGLLISWLLYSDRCILSDKSRNLLRLLGFMLIFYIFLRACKYNYFRDYEIISRILWYLYYIPQIFVPQLLLCISMRIGKPEEYKLPRIFKYITAFSIILCILILTNDLHFYAFSFNPGMVDWNNDYDRGPVYITAAVWIYILLFSAVGIMTYKFRNLDRKKVWIPLFWLGTGSIYLLLIAIIPLFDKFKPFNLPETECFIIIAMIESCIRTGLIPSNTSYADFVENSGSSVFITDKKHNIIYKSFDAAEVSENDMVKAEKGPVYLNENTLLQSDAVTGGNIYWVDDLSNINEINDRLSEISESLSAKNEILRAENEIKSQKAKIAEQNRLYDQISHITEPQLNLISLLLDKNEPYTDNMIKICVLSCYIKRRANLTLLACTNKNIDIYELYLSIRESLEYFKLQKTAGYISVTGTGTAPSEFILFAFDWWEEFCEQSFSDIRACLINLSWDDSVLIMKISVETDVSYVITDKNKETLGRLKGSYNLKVEDGTCFIDLILRKDSDYLDTSF